SALRLLQQRSRERDRRPQGRGEAVHRRSQPNRGVTGRRLAPPPRRTASEAERTGEWIARNGAGVQRRRRGASRTDFAARENQKTRTANRDSSAGDAGTTRAASDLLADAGRLRSAGQVQRTSAGAAERIRQPSARSTRRPVGSRRVARQSQQSLDG